jgi:hypothetical protein
MLNDIMFIVGCSMLGFLLPEVIAAIGKAGVSYLTNIWSMVAVGLIAASFVL